MKYPFYKKVGMDQESSINCTSVTTNKDAGIIVPSQDFQYCLLKKSKRYRSAFTTEQINYLESEFKKFPYIGSANRKEIANILKISERAIKIWFQNRRMKEKREVSNKESSKDDKNNINNTFPNEQLNIFNEPSDNNKAHILPIRQHGSSKESQINNAPINVRNLNLAIERKNKTIVPSKYSNNPSKIKPILQHKIQNHSKISDHPTFDQKTTCYNDLSHTEKQYDHKLNKPISIQSMKSCEMAQDLSLSRNKKVQQSFCSAQLNSDELIHTQNYFVPPVVSTATRNSGNVVWKPVSLMPIMPGLASPATIGHNNAEFSLNNQGITKGTCNCHGPPHAFNPQDQCSSRLQPQYILAIPFSNLIPNI